MQIRYLPTPLYKPYSSTFQPLHSNAGARSQHALPHGAPPRFGGIFNVVRNWFDRVSGTSHDKAAAKAQALKEAQQERLETQKKLKAHFYLTFEKLRETFEKKEKTEQELLAVQSLQEETTNPKELTLLLQIKESLEKENSHLSSKIESLESMLKTLKEEINESSQTYNKRQALEQKAILDAGVPQLLTDMPSFLAALDLNTLIPLLKNTIEDPNDQYYRYNFNRSLGIHPNEAELLLLMRHPNIFAPQNQKARIGLVGALTSITHFIAHNVQEVSDEIIQAWGDIGALSLGFRH